MKKQTLKLSIILILVTIFVALWLRALTHTPVDTGQKLSAMREPSDTLTQIGGVILNKQEKVRANIVTIFAGVDATSWNSTLLLKYQKAIQKQGWTTVQETDALLKYCKDGILLDIYKIPQTEMQNGVARSVYSIIVQYGAMTVDECGAL